MPDNVQLPVTGTGTADVVVATDQVGTAQYQYVKLADGTRDNADPIEGDWSGGHKVLMVEDRALRRLFEEFLVAQQPEPLTWPQWLDQRSTSIRTGHVTVSNKPTLIAQANLDRKRITIVNYQTVIVYWGESSVSTTTGVRLDPGTPLTLQTGAEIWGVTTSTYSPVGEDDRVHLWDELSGR